MPVNIMKNNRGIGEITVLMIKAELWFLPPVFFIVLNFIYFSLVFFDFRWMDTPEDFAVISQRKTTFADRKLSP